MEINILILFTHRNVFTNIGRKIKTTKDMEIQNKIKFVLVNKMIIKFNILINCQFLHLISKYANDIVEHVFRNNITK